MVQTEPDSREDSGQVLGPKALETCQEGEALLSRIPLARLDLGIEGIT